jgi:hypothetical protein
VRQPCLLGRTKRRLHCERGGSQEAVLVGSIRRLQSDWQQHQSTPPSLSGSVLAVAVAVVPAAQLHHDSESGSGSGSGCCCCCCCCW